MGNQKDKSHGGIPNHLLNQLIEHTAGGFIIFYFNSESGAPEHAMTFDSPAHCLALQKYITDWAIALGDINIENARHDIEKAVGEDTDGLDGQDP